MEIKIKVKHKELGWTGELIIDTFIHTRYTSSHALGCTVDFDIEQDTHDPTGKYVEEPRSEELTELCIPDLMAIKRLLEESPSILTHERYQKGYLLVCQLSGLEPITNLPYNRPTNDQQTEDRGKGQLSLFDQS